MVINSNSCCCCLSSALKRKHLLNIHLFFSISSNTLQTGWWWENPIKRKVSRNSLSYLSCISCGIFSWLLAIWNEKQLCPRLLPPFTLNFSPDKWQVINTIILLLEKNTDSDPKLWKPHICEPYASALEEKGCKRDYCFKANRRGLQTVPGIIPSMSSWTTQGPF